MRLKTFRAVTMREAMDRAAAELGPNAVVVEARDLGPGRVELLAGVDDEPDAPRRGSQSSAGARGSDADLIAQLVARGVEASVAQALLDRADQGAAGLSRAVAAAFTPAPAVWERPGRAIAAFVGPTGVGKTTTLAKVTAEAALRHGKRVGIVAADTFRIGAVDQVRTYAELLGVPWVPASNQRELATALSRLGQQDLILVDTAGGSPWSDGTHQALDRLLSGLPVERYLCVAANTSGADLAAMGQRYGRVRSVVMTKTDEARNMGGILSLLLGSELKLSHVTCGQTVPTDLERPNPARLAQAVMG